MTDTYFSTIAACVDCLMLLANGEVTDGHGNDITAAQLDAIAAQWGDDGTGGAFHLVPACGDECEGWFSWQPCEACGCKLGGDRHPVAVFTVRASVRT